MKYQLMQKKKTGQYLRNMGMGNKINFSKELKIFLEDSKLDTKIPSWYNGKTHRWYGQDILSEYKKWKKYGILDYYEKNKLTYIINNDGCRSELDFNKVIQDNKPVDIYLGCSHTFGTGHLWENTWPYLVSKETGNKIVNLGKGGTGIDFAFLRLITFIKKMNVKNVFHYQPIYSRWTFKNENSLAHIGFPSNMEDATNFFTQKYIMDNLADYGYIAFNHLKTSNAIKQVCLEHNVPYYYLETFKTEFEKVPKPCLPDKNLAKYKKWLGKNTPARDVLHFPVEWLRELANNFIEKFKDEPNGYVESNIKLPSRSQKVI